jgi:hypothetical protein
VPSIRSHRRFSFATIKNDFSGTIFFSAWLVGWSLWFHGRTSWLSWLLGRWLASRVASFC